MSDLHDRLYNIVNKTFEDNMLRKVMVLSCIVGLALATAGCNIKGSYKSNFISLCNFNYTDVESTYGPDSLYFESVIPDPSGSMTFNNKLNEINGFGGGFLLSALRDTTFKAGYFKSAYSVADTSKATLKDNGFAVYSENLDKNYMPAHSISFIYSDIGQCTARGVQVCNTNKLANIIMFGAGGVPKFEVGDYLTVKFTGYLGTSVTGSVEEKLAECTGSGLTLLRGWKTVDLTKIGSFTNIEISFVSNRDDLPHDVCVDNFIASVNIEQ